MASKKNGLYEKIYAVVERIPSGMVATYGQIARVAGLGGQARLVGYALRNLPSERDVPWHRVINAQGRISQGSRGEGVNIQRQWLEEEGVEFDLKGKVDLDRFGWEGDLFPL